MLPGKAYSPVDYLMMVWHRKWFLIVPTILISAGTFVWTYSLPNIYRSEASVLIVPQKVPEDFVRSSVTTQIEDRLQMISSTILSRSRLERIVNDFNLYEEERKTQIMEDVIERMRSRDVDIDIITNRRRGAEATAFKIAYVSEKPRLAQQVADRLASQFVQENIEDRGTLAESTNQFLRSQLEDARRRLLESEKKLEAFRQRNAGRLPSQVQSNLQMLQGNQARVQAIAEQASQDRNRLTVIEGVLAEAQRQMPVVVAPGGDAGPTMVSPSTPQLQAARAALRGLELRGLSTEHPDVKRELSRIAELEAKVEAELLEQPLNAPAAIVAVNTGELARLNALRIEAQEIRGRLETQKTEAARLQAAMSGYANRVEAAPGLESELTELMRDYQTLQATYNQLSLKNEESKMALNLERGQIGEQFRVLDSARLPERPISPNRSRYNLLGLAAGLGFGLALIALLEYRDTSFKSDDDILVSLALPVLAVVPAMLSERERKAERKLKLVLALSGASIMLMAAGGALLWHFDVLERLVR